MRKTVRALKKTQRLGFLTWGRLSSPGLLSAPFQDLAKVTRERGRRGVPSLPARSNSSAPFCPHTSQQGPIPTIFTVSHTGPRITAFQNQHEFPFLSSAEFCAQSGVFSPSCGAACLLPLEASFLSSNHFPP